MLCNVSVYLILELVLSRFLRNDIYSSIFSNCAYCAVLPFLLEQNKFSKKVASNRDGTCDPRTVVLTSCVDMVFGDC